MKRLLLLLTLFAGAATFTSCEGDAGPQGPQGPAGPTNLVFELQNVNFTLDANNEYTIYRTFANTPIGGNLFDGETVLIYRLSGTIDSNTPIWQLIPRTLFLPQGELDYDFDFSKEDFYIYAGGNYDVSTTPAYLNSQTFRIVVLSNSFSDKNAANASVDFKDYNAVIQKYGLDDKNVKVIK